MFTLFLRSGQFTGEEEGNISLEGFLFIYLFCKISEAWNAKRLPNRERSTINITAGVIKTGLYLTLYEMRTSGEQLNLESQVVLPRKCFTCIPVFFPEATGFLWALQSACRQLSSCVPLGCLREERPQNRLPLPEHCLQPAPRSSLSEGVCMPLAPPPPRSCTKRKILVKHENTGADFAWYQMPRSAPLAAGDPCLGSGRACRGSENGSPVLPSG